MQNPYITENSILPVNAYIYKNRANYVQGMILKNDVCYNAFTKRGWTWGGDWNTKKDYQHFEK